MNFYFRKFEQSDKLITNVTISTSFSVSISNFKKNDDSKEIVNLRFPD